MSYIKTKNKEWVWQRIGYEDDNRGIVILGLLEAYISTKRVLSVEELIPLLSLTPKQTTDAYRRTAKEFLLGSRKLTVTEGFFRDLEDLEGYKKAPYKGRSLKEALELLIAEAKKNNIKFPKVLKKTSGNEKVNTSLNNEIDSAKGYLPTKEDCEKVVEQLRSTSKSLQILTEDVLDLLAKKIQEKGIMLRDNWRIITKEKFRNWFKD